MGIGLIYRYCLHFLADMLVLNILSYTILIDLTIEISISLYRTMQIHSRSHLLTHLLAQCVVSDCRACHFSLCCCLVVGVYAGAISFVISTAIIFDIEYIVV